MASGPVRGGRGWKTVGIAERKVFFVHSFFSSFVSVFCRDLRKVEEVLDESLYKRWDILTDPAALSAQVIMNDIFFSPLLLFFFSWVRADIPLKQAL